MSIAVHSAQRTESTVIGTIDFYVNYPVKGRKAKAVPALELQSINDDAYGFLLSRLHHIESRLQRDIGLNVQIRDGVVWVESIRFRDGRLIVTTPALALLVVGYLTIKDYGDLRNSLILIFSDIRSAFTTLMSEDWFGEIEFKSTPDETVLRDIIPYLPEREYRIVLRDRPDLV